MSNNHRTSVYLLKKLRDYWIPNLLPVLFCFVLFLNLCWQHLRTNKMSPSMNTLPTWIISCHVLKCAPRYGSSGSVLIDRFFTVRFRTFEYYDWLFLGSKLILRFWLQRKSISCFHYHWLYHFVFIFSLHICKALKVRKSIGNEATTISCSHHHLVLVLVLFLYLKSSLVSLVIHFEMDFLLIL